MLYEAELPGIPTTIVLSNKTGGPTKSEIVYGTSDGRLGQVEIGRSVSISPVSFCIPSPLLGTSISASTKWEIANPKHLSGISGIDFFDILADGVADMIVAREDGTVEVYNFETAEEPILKYTYVGASDLSSPGNARPSFRTERKVSRISKVDRLAMLISMN